MQEYHIEQTAFFAKQVKKLTKRYRKIGKDIDHFLEGIQNIDHLGIALGNNLYKTRIRNSSAQKGKSGGFRLFTLVNYNTKQIVLQKNKKQPIDSNMVYKSYLLGQMVTVWKSYQPLGLYYI